MTLGDLIRVHNAGGVLVEELAPVAGQAGGTVDDVDTTGAVLAGHFGGTPTARTVVAGVA